MSVMSETASGLSDLLTQGNKLVEAARKTLNELEALLQMLERASGQNGETEALRDSSVVPEEVLKEAAPADEVKKEAPPRTARLEEVRPVLAEKSRAGYRAEVKALLTKYGAYRLSDIRDEAVLGAILNEAERLGL